MAYARDMNQNLASKFIGMYVNDFTRDYGETDALRSADFWPTRAARATSTIWPKSNSPSE